MYANPFNGGFISWVGDPNNEWVYLSYALVVVILCSGVWLIHGTVTFFKAEPITASIAGAMFIGVLIMLAEGEKFQPTDNDQLMTAALFGLAFFSTCGRVFAMAADQKDKK
jgi:hypothetical protein